MRLLERSAMSSKLRLFLTSFPSDYHVASFCTSFTPCGFVFTGGTEGSLLSSKPRLILHKLAIILSHGNVFTGVTEGSMLSSKPRFFPSPAFHLTTTWQCVHWWN